MSQIHAGVQTPKRGAGSANEQRAVRGPDLFGMPQDAAVHNRCRSPCRQRAPYYRWGRQPATGPMCNSTTAIQRRVPPACRACRAGPLLDAFGGQASLAPASSQAPALARDLQRLSVMAEKESNLACAHWQRPVSVSSPSTAL